MFVIADQQPAEGLRNIQMLRLQRGILLQYYEGSQPISIYRNRKDRAFHRIRLSRKQPYLIKRTNMVRFDTFLKLHGQ